MTGSTVVAEGSIGDRYSGRKHASTGFAFLPGLCVALLTLTSMVPARLSAQIAAAGPEFQVNTYTTGRQDSAAIAAAANGDFVVVWNSRDQDGNGYGNFGQRFASNGTKLGAEFQVNTYTDSDQYPADVGSAPNGDFVVVWHSYGQDSDSYGIFGQRYASSGAALGGEFQVNTYTDGGQTDPAVAVGGNGDFVVVWSSYYEDGDSQGIFGQRFASSGSPAGIEFQVNTYTTGRQRLADVAAAPNGDFVVVWQSAQDGSVDGVFGQRFASGGSAVGGEFQVNTFTQNRQAYPAAATAADGSFVVTWSSYGNHDGDGWGIFAQRYDSSGGVAGSEFQVNTYTSNTQIASDVAAAANGDFIVTWQSRLQDSDQEGIFGQRYASDGSLIGGEFQVNSYTTSVQYLPAIAAAPNGDFIVAWESDKDGDGLGIFAQRYATMPAPSSTITATPTTTPTTTPTATPTATPTGTAMASACAPTPLTGCTIPGKSLLLIKDKGEDGAGPGDKLVWKWLKGTAVTQPGFGNPTTSAYYHFCVYAGTAALAVDATVPPGPPWAAISTKGYKYKDPTAAVAGIKQILLKGGDAGKSKILVKGKDAGLGLTAATLPFTSPNVLVQLSNSDNSNCFQTTFPVASAKKNTEGLFKAKGP